jgi:ubiquitin-small subunit ribosomal protein S27Ae
VSKYYNLKGETLERVKKSCNKCGEGYFMAEHKDRYSCGKCGFTEFKKKGSKK